MFRRTKVCSAVLLAMGGGLVWVPALAQAPAQEATQRVEITGSSIRRIDAETALPVQVIKREDIVKSGATSTVDLLQKLPAIQGSVMEAASVGGQAFGFSSVSLHNLGDTRTLVLLNGRRITQFGGAAVTGFASAVDLNSIPVAAIERIEILTDGASAIYGSDAVAGVVNFITKRNSQEGDISVGYSRPSGGAKETRFSISKGFGDLDTDGFNALIAFSADKRTKLASIDRDFAKSGLLDFTHKGKPYRFFLGSGRGIPANVATLDGRFFNPYFLETGECPPNHVLQGEACIFDFTSQLEIYPARTTRCSPTCCSRVPRRLRASPRCRVKSQSRRAVRCMTNTSHRMALSATLLRPIASSTSASERPRTRRTSIT
jgi:iron complex outermembrane recepter protein